MILERERLNQEIRDKCPHTAGSGYARLMPKLQMDSRLLKLERTHSSAKTSRSLSLAATTSDFVLTIRQFIHSSLTRQKIQMIV